MADDTSTNSGSLPDPAAPGGEEGPGGSDLGSINEPDSRATEKPGGGALPDPTRHGSSDPPDTAG